MLCAPSFVRVTLAGVVLALTVVGCGDDEQPPPTGPSPTIPLRVIGLQPGAGNAVLNTTVTIIGNGFQTGATLTVGGVAVPMALTNTAQARATVPPHAPGAVDVVVTNPNGERAQLTGGFQYVDVPARLDITGNMTLQSIGQSSQLTATATFSDGRSQDVTREARWSSQYPLVLSVAADGVITGRALGLTLIFVQYPQNGPSVFRSGQGAVTPAGTFALSGRVREPGGGGITGARVIHVDSGRAVDSDGSGEFSFGGLTGQPRVRVTKTGYEDSEAEGRPNAVMDAPIQRVVHVLAGAETYTSQLAPNDVEHRAAPATSCQPCRLIRVTTTTPGPATITMRWTGSSAVQLWVNGRAFQADPGTREIVAEVTLGGSDTIVFVGPVATTSLDGYIPFNVVVRQ